MRRWGPRNEVSILGNAHVCRSRVSAASARRWWWRTSNGLIVDSVVHVGIDGDALAALAAFLYRQTKRAVDAAGLGGATFFQVEAATGHVCGVGKGNVLLIVLADVQVNIGKLRWRCFAQRNRWRRRHNALPHSAYDSLPSRDLAPRPWRHPFRPTLTPRCRVVG